MFSRLWQWLQAVARPEAHFAAGVAEALARRPELEYAPYPPVETPEPPCPIWETTEFVLEATRHAKTPGIWILDCSEPSWLLLVCNAPFSTGQAAQVFRGMVGCYEGPRGDREFRVKQQVAVKLNTQKAEDGQAVSNTGAVLSAISVKYEVSLMRRLLSDKFPLYAQLMYTAESSAAFRRRWGVVNPAVVMEYVESETLQSYHKQFVRATVEMFGNFSKKTPKFITNSVDNHVSCLMAQILTVNALSISQGILNPDLHYRNILVSKHETFLFTTSTSSSAADLDVVCPRLRFVDLGLGQEVDDVAVATHTALLTTFVLNVLPGTRNFNPHLLHLAQELLLQPAGCHADRVFEWLSRGDSFSAGAVHASVRRLALRTFAKLKTDLDETRMARNLREARAPRGFCAELCCDAVD